MYLGSSLCLLLFLQHGTVSGYRIFRGRPVNGSVGVPKVTSRDWKSDHLPADRWFEQKLNHFDSSDTRTWKQRYFVNDSFYSEGGPVFLQIGGEGTANPIWLVEGQCVKYAQRFNALVILLEHRYYGKSHPTPDMSVENLKYLSSEQALADLAAFRQFIASKRKLPEQAKWISFGGSYPGSLAAWFRLKYPHLVYASVSSSAPMTALVDFKDYLRVVRDSLATTGPSCNEAIKGATDEIRRLLHRKTGSHGISKKFKLCQELDPRNKEDVWNFYSSLAGNFEGVVQYNKDNRKFEGAVGTDITIDKLCSIMNNGSIGGALDRYAAVNSLMIQTYSQKCLDHKYLNFVDQLKNISWSGSAAEGGRQWTYQTCTEFGFFQSSDLKNQPFGNGFPVEFFLQQCLDIFGNKFDLALLRDGIDRTNTNYGGRNINVTRVIFINGSIDPWHALGITRSLSEAVPAILINGTAHCANMYPDSAQDPPQLRQSRILIEDQIKSWLNE